MELPSALKTSEFIDFLKISLINSEIWTQNALVPIVKHLKGMSVVPVITQVAESLCSTL